MGVETGLERLETETGPRATYHCRLGLDAVANLLADALSPRPCHVWGVRVK